MSTTFYMNISQLFNVNPDLSSECIGTSSKNTVCHRPISANTRAGATTTLHSLERLESIDELLNQLQSISSKLLCHQYYDQRDIICEQWWQALLDLSRNSLPEFRVPGGFPEEDQNILALVLELSRLKVDKSFQWREEEAKRAEAERAEAKRAAKRASKQAAERRAEARRAEARRVEGRRAGKSRRRGYQEWMKDSETARKSFKNVPFPDPPSYGCYNTACKVFRNESRIE